MEYQRLPSMYDLSPFPPAKDPWQNPALWRYVEGVFREVCRRFGYREIRTPIMEERRLFERHIGAGTDIVSKEMFAFRKGDDDIALKPEGTAPVVRAAIENSYFAQTPILKLYYIGQNFRAEHGQRGRYRQHQQLGVEVFGVADAQIDAEVIALAIAFYKELGISDSDMDLRINSVGTPESRVAYSVALREFVQPFLAEMTEDGQRRFGTNPLRMLDTKHEHELRLLEGAPHLVDYLDAESAAHFEQIQAHLQTLGIAYRVDHHLVRGFDYYTKTAFEITGKHLGSQSALGGGGRYDGLVEDCGGPSVPGIGFGLGMERCLITLEEMGIVLPVPSESPLAFLIVLGSGAETQTAAVKILADLRAAGFAVDRDYRGGKFPAQVKQADLVGAKYTLILGESELANGEIQLRNQATKEQRAIPMGSLVVEMRGL